MHLCRSGFHDAVTEVACWCSAGLAFWGAVSSRMERMNNIAVVVSIIMISIMAGVMVETMVDVMVDAVVDVMIDVVVDIVVDKI